MKKFSGSSSKKVISPRSDFIIFIFLFSNYISFSQNSFVFYFFTDYTEHSGNSF